MTWLRRIGWTAVAIATLALAVGSFFFQLPTPQASYVIDRGMLYFDDGHEQDVRLPLRGKPNVDLSEPTRFAAHFDLPTIPPADLFLLIPTPNRHLQLRLNGQVLFDTMSHAVWVGPAVGSPILVRLPRRLLIEGQNEFSLVLGGGDFVLSIYLPEIYIGGEEALATAFKAHLWVDDRLKTMSLAAQLLLGLGVLFAYLFRPQDSLLSWLAGLIAANWVLSIGFFVGFDPRLHAILPYLSSLMPAPGFLGIGVACCVAGLTPPRALVALVFAVPAACILLVFAGIVPAQTVPALMGIAIFVVAFAIGTGITAWGAVWRGLTEARMMLAPYILLCIFVLRDAAVGVGVLDRPLIVLSPYIRPIFLIGVIAVLMRRLVVSLDRLDSANENLNRRLIEQEAQLDTLHRAEQIEAAQLVREQERLRLTHDLHDGISGHLVSIIAMTEGEGTAAAPIEQAARRALDDLRLVIYSLDLGERDLPLALANFRERLIPQLQRARVELDWSTVGLPEVLGVTPSNALSILRVLQEALTNALKHGPASKIVIRGGPADGMVAITVENDGHPFAESERGFGLANMRRRARALQGEIVIDAIDHGTRLTLLLPAYLPDVRDDGPNGFRQSLQAQRADSP